MAPTVTLDCSKAQVSWRHHVAVWLWIGWLAYYLIVLAALPFLLYYVVFRKDEACIRFLTWFVGVKLVLLLIPCDRKYQPKWAMDLGDWIAKGAVEYFHMKVVFEDEAALQAKENQPAFFVLEPHDVLPLSIMSFHEATGAFARAGHRSVGCVTSTCFHVPLMRHFYSWAGAVPATKEVINDMISSGISPCICPGGVQEVGLITKQTDEINVYLKERKGFIKLAMSRGVPIVPVFAFGGRDAFDFVIATNSVLRWIGRKLGFMPMIFFGVGGIPFAPGKSCHYTNVVGKPISTGPKKNYKDITPAEVDAIQAKYLKEVMELFLRHRGDPGYSGVKLNIH
jgi:2-acylglycerol O-acyltransferase 2